MIIKSIILENFQCYYGNKKFELENGLNIILGDNGEGKTKFFEAVHWLFNGDRYNLEDFISKKKIVENYNLDTFEVSVTMKVISNKYTKILKKSFEVEANTRGIFTTKWKFIGIDENDKGEREQVSGDRLLEEIFPAKIRKYSMFKGESDLDIFKGGEQALSNLVKSFSSANFYDKYCIYSEYFKTKAEKAVDKDVKNTSKKQKELKDIIYSLERNLKELDKLNSEYNLIERNLEKTQCSLDEADKHFHHAEKLSTIKERIKNLKNKISSNQVKIVDDFTTRLFDDNWMLINFEKIQTEFSEKINGFDKRRRNEEKLFNIEKGKQQQVKEIIEEFTPLPLGVPSILHMEEMLDEQICKVCNRSATEGSDAYSYMFERLEKFKQSQVIKDENAPVELFKYNYTQKLFSFNDSYSKQLSFLRGIRTQINEVFKFNKKRNEEILFYQKQLMDEEREIEKIIASSASEFDLMSIHKNSRKWSKEISDMERKKIRIESDIQNLTIEIEDLRKKKDEIDKESASSFLLETQKILRHIHMIFTEVRENKYNEFIVFLQKKANEIFSSINIDDFTGNIKLSKKGKKMIFVELFENDRLYKNPNQSLETTMHMSILFAISELATELSTGVDQYPIIFDAPTSSFGLKKTSDFLNLVSETGKQRIILTYEFVGRDSEGNQIIESEFEKVNKAKAFWLKREKFNKNDLSTINTLITEI